MRSTKKPPQQRAKLNDQTRIGTPTRKKSCTPQQESSQSAGSHEMRSQWILSQVALPLPSSCVSFVYHKPEGVVRTMQTRAHRENICPEHSIAAFCPRG